jgi:hypothetical protein
LTGKETAATPGRWALITLHPSLPSKSEQIARARVWGLAPELLDGEDISALIIEDVQKVKRTTHWAGKLPKRATLLDSLKSLKPESGQVFFATPLCVGFGPAHAMQTIEALWSANVSVYVHSTGAAYKAGDDMTEFLEQVSHEANVAYVRAHRAKKPKTKRKS